MIEYEYTTLDKLLTTNNLFGITSKHLTKIVKSKKFRQRLGVMQQNEREGYECVFSVYQPVFSNKHTVSSLFLGSSEDTCRHLLLDDSGNLTGREIEDPTELFKEDSLDSLLHYCLFDIHSHPGELTPPSDVDLNYLFNESRYDEIRVKPIGGITGRDKEKYKLFLFQETVPRALNLEDIDEISRKINYGASPEESAEFLRQNGYNAEVLTLGKNNSISKKDCAKLESFSFTPVIPKKILRKIVYNIVYGKGDDFDYDKFLLEEEDDN